MDWYQALANTTPNAYQIGNKESNITSIYDFAKVVVTLNFCKPDIHYMWVLEAKSHI